MKLAQSLMEEQGDPTRYVPTCWFVRYRCSSTVGATSYSPFPFTSIPRRKILRVLPSKAFPIKNDRGHGQKESTRSGMGRTDGMFSRSACVTCPCNHQHQDSEFPNPEWPEWEII